MKLVHLFIVTIFSLSLHAQTTLEEFDYLTRDYARAIAQSDNPIKEGYYFENLLDMVDKSGKVLLLYREDQESLIPTATQMHVYDGAKTFYLCIPHDDSPKVVLDKHADDLQRMFEASETARVNYGKIMKVYPRQLKKYFAEIRALEANLVSNEPDTPSREVSNTREITKVENEPNTEVVEPQMDRTNRKPLVEIEPTKAPILTNKDPKKVNKRPSVGKRSKCMLNARLKTREVVGQPPINNLTNTMGNVKVQVCINAQGRVISANFVRKGSDTRDEDLVNQAVKLAKQHRFAKSHRSRQCGSMVFSFK